MPSEFLQRGTTGRRTFTERADRLVPRRGILIEVRGCCLGLGSFEGQLFDLSRNGCQFLVVAGKIKPKCKVEGLILIHGNRTSEIISNAEVSWVDVLGNNSILVAGVRFQQPQDQLIEELRPLLRATPRPQASQQTISSN